MLLRLSEKSKTASRQYRFTIWIGALTLMLGIVLASFFALYQQRASALDHAGLIAQTLGRSVEQTFGSMIGSVQNALFASRDEISRQIQTGKADTVSINTYLTQQTNRMSTIRTMHAANEQGDIVYGPYIHQPAVNIADREYFESLKSHADKDWIVSSAIKSWVSDEWIWSFGTRVNQIDDTFMGVVVAEIRLGDINSMLEKILEGGGPGNLIAIRDERLLLVARHAIGVKNTIQPGITGLSKELRQALNLNNNSGTYFGGASSVDGIQRVYFYSRHPTYGFLTVVGVSIESALTDWRHEVWMFSLFILGALLLVFFFARHLIHTFDRHAFNVEQIAAEQNQSHILEHYDRLTQLPNRLLLRDRLNQALVSSLRTGMQGALLFIDLDNFKTLNDSLGHGVGDLLLKQASQRILLCIRTGDTVARAGGDDFVVVLEDLGEQDSVTAIQAEEMSQRILLALSKPYQLGEYTYNGTASIGIALFKNNDQSADDLLMQADIAMYQAKEAGRNCFRFLDPVVQEKIAQRAQLETELRQALELQQFELYYQLQVDQFGAPIGAEALIRWNHPERGLIGPFDFIPLAEETGLILAIGKWVLESACKQIGRWKNDPVMCDLKVSVNVSAKQFRESDFVAQVEALLRCHAIPASRLKLELTEGIMLDNTEAMIQTMWHLKTTGVQFSLDDFGTGYSSLQYLKVLPLDQLKIDQSFLRNLAVDNNDKIIIETIIAMAKALNLDVIAEGVETVEQKQFLIERGCIHLQGYLFSKPIPIQDFEALVAAG